MNKASLPDPHHNMFRLPRPKLFAEFALFLFIATTFTFIALHVTNRGFSFNLSNQPNALAIYDASDKAKNNTLQAIQDADGYTIGVEIVSEVKVDLSHGMEENGRAGKLLKGVSSSNSKVETKVDQTFSNVDSLKNIAKPYYTIVTDQELKIDRSYFRLRPTRVSTIPDQFRIASETVCHPHSPSTLFIVPSVATAQAATERFEIRKTWASDLYDPAFRQTSPVRLLFFFGSSGLKPTQLKFLEGESKRYGDIVAGEFLDSYGNLSLKMAVTLTWVAKNCPNIKAAIKIDMDTYVNVKLLLKLIDQLPYKTHPNFVFGHMHGAQQPVVVREGGWAVPKPVYPFDKFPRYIYGHSYVVSGPAVKLMANGFPYFPVVPNEDAFATGIVPVTLNITRFHHDSFAYLLEKRTLCDMTQGIHVTAVMKRENRLKLWNAFQTGACIKEALNG